MTKETGKAIRALESIEEAVRAADLICTTTSSKDPLIKGKWLKRGTHVNLVGAAIASSTEVDEDVVTRSRYFTDYRPAAMAAAGELLRAIETGAASEDTIIAEIGEVANGTIAGRTSEDEITVYKSLGVAAQDLAVGHKLYEMAVRDEVGTEINMMDFNV